jgi:hypothetical protein
LFCNKNNREYAVFNDFQVTVINFNPKTQILTSQNKGHLSQTKRKLPAFAKLTDEEIIRLEEAIAATYPPSPNRH